MKKTRYTALLTSLFTLLAFTSWATNYTTVASGQWSSATNWTPIGVPSAGDNVTIFGREIVLDVAGLSINSLLITNGGSLIGTNTLNTTGNLEISLGAIFLNGNITVGGNLTLNASSIGSSSASVVTDLTVSGFTTFTISSLYPGFDNQIVKKKLTMNGGGSWSNSGRVIVRDGSTFEIPVGQTFTFNQGTTNFEDFSTAGNYVVIKGTLQKLGTGNLRMSSTASAVITLNNTGSILVDAGSFEINSPYTGNGSIAVASGATLIPSTSGLNYQNATFNNNGTANTNILIFNGSTQQTITGTGSINRLQLNNASGLIITGPQTIVTDLTFTSGKIQLGNNDLTLTAGATITGADAAKYVQTNSTGNLKRTVGNSDFLFPVGESNYTPVTIKHTVGTDVYAVRVSDGIDITHPLLGTQYIGKEWDISRATVSSTPATVKLEWNSADVGVGYSTATAQMLHYNSGSSNWEQLPVGNRTASTALSLTQSGVTSFSPFSVGVPAFVLTAELIDFKAISHKSTVDLLWQTASERDMSHFDIEQSTDGLTFSKIGETKAANKANSYIFNVEGPLSIRTYFRLKIVNSDGSFTYSKVLSVAFGKELTVKAFPNPIQNELTIDLFSDSKQLDIEVIDVLSRSIYQKNEQNTEGSKLLIINTLEWLSGIYFLKVSDGKKVFQQKIVKR
jgi:hypothetical protein